MLSCDISFVAGNIKFLRVEVNNFGYFWVLNAQVTFITYLFTRVTFSFMLSYVLDLLLPVSNDLS